MDFKPLEIKEKYGGGLQNNSKLVQNGVLRCLCYGRSGSGKTYFITAVYSQMIHEPIGGVWVFAKAQNQDSYKSLQKWSEKKGIDFTITDEYDDETFEEITSTEAPKFILYDDLASDDNIKNLVKTFKFGRHSNCYICVLSQNYTSIPKEVRNNVNLCIIFPLSSPYIARGVINAMSSFADEDALKTAYRVINKNKHSCIFLNMEQPTSFLITKDFQILDLNTLQPVTDANLPQAQTETKSKKNGKGKQIKDKEDGELLEGDEDDNIF